MDSHPDPANSDLIDTVSVAIVRLPHAGNLPLPSYESALAAGMDLAAAVDAPLSLEPGDWAVIPTGLAIALPPGFEAQVRPRSGLAARKGITVLNSPGTVDADYRGEIKVPLINHGREPFMVDPGARIAQLVIARHATVQWQEVAQLDPTRRGAGGFGSTGV